jgi:hypothetical protein
MGYGILKTCYMKLIGINYMCYCIMNLLYVTNYTSFTMIGIFYNRSSTLI